MRLIFIAAATAAAASMTMAPVAQAKPHHHVPPGLAKKHHHAPPGHRRWARGERLPRAYYETRTYYVVEPTRYHLRRPPPGYEWVRVGNDVYLAQTRTGLIAEVIADLLG